MVVIALEAASPEFYPIRPFPLDCFRKKLALTLFDTITLFASLLMTGCTGWFLSLSTCKILKQEIAIPNTRQQPVPMSALVLVCINRD